MYMPARAMDAKTREAEDALFYSFQPSALHPIAYWSRSTAGFLASLRDTFYVLSVHLPPPSRRNAAAAASALPANGSRRGFSSAHQQTHEVTVKDASSYRRRCSHQSAKRYSVMSSPAARAAPSSFPAASHPQRTMSRQCIAPLSNDAARWYPALALLESRLPDRAEEVSSFVPLRAPDCTSFRHDPMIRSARLTSLLERQKEAAMEKEEKQTSHPKDSKSRERGLVSAKYRDMYLNLLEDMPGLQRQPYLSGHIAPTAETIKAQLAADGHDREVQRKLHLWCRNRKAYLTPPTPSLSLQNDLRSLMESDAHAQWQLHLRLRPLFPKDAQIDPAHWHWLSTAQAKLLLDVAALTEGPRGEEHYLCLRMIRGLFHILHYRGAADADVYHALVRAYLRTRHYQDAVLALHHSRVHNVQWNKRLALDHWKLGKKLGLTHSKGPPRLSRPKA